MFIITITTFHAIALFVNLRNWYRVIPLILLSTHMLKNEKAISLPENWPVLSTIAGDIRRIHPSFQTAIYLTTKAFAFLTKYVIVNPTPITLMVGVDCLIDTFTVAVKAAGGETCRQFNRTVHFGCTPAYPGYRFIH